MAEGGSDFSAPGGESLNKKISLRGGTNFLNFAPEMPFLRGFGQFFEGLLNIDKKLLLTTKNAREKKFPRFENYSKTHEKCTGSQKFAKFRGGSLFQTRGEGYLLVLREGQFFSPEGGGCSPLAHL